jgi:autonomous glycyl radical cofactor GrcA
MKDYYLRFSTYEEMLDSLKLAEYTYLDENETEKIISATHQICIDVVGEIYRGGKWEFNDTGELIVTEEPVKLGGYHVNVRVLSGDIHESLLQYVVIPNNPYRIFG